MLVLLCWPKFTGDAMDTSTTDCAKYREEREAPIGFRFKLRKPAALVPLALILLSPVHGADRVVSGYFDAGKRDVFDDFDDEGFDDEYTYRNYNLKYEDAGFDRVDYAVSTFQKSRNYKNTNDLDNHASTYQGKASYAFPTEDPLLAGLDVRNKQKRFENTPRNEYDQNVVTPFLTKSKKDLYRLTLETALDDTQYKHAEDKDAATWIGRINGNRYFDGGRVNLLSSYSLARTEKPQAFKERTKQDWMGKGTYKFDNPWIDKAALRANAGQRDSKEDEDFDIDYDYRYWSVSAETFHAIGEDTSATLEYEYLDKNYLAYNRGHTEYSVQNEWKRAFINDPKARAWASVILGHKEANFPLLTGINLKRETIGMKAVYWRKKTWTATILAEADVYDFNDSQTDKKRYNVAVEWNKDLMDGALDFTLGGKYSYTDYRAKNDTERGSVRAAFEYKL